MTTCPFCAEEIQDAAIVCKHCGRALSAAAAIAPASVTSRRATSVLRITLLVAGLLALIPLTFGFGLFGFLGGLFFLLLAAFAK